VLLVELPTAVRGLKSPQGLRLICGLGAPVLLRRGSASQAVDQSGGRHSCCELELELKL